MGKRKKKFPSDVATNFSSPELVLESTTYAGDIKAAYSAFLYTFFDLLTKMQGKLPKYYEINLEHAFVIDHT